MPHVMNWEREALFIHVRSKWRGDIGVLVSYDSGYLSVTYDHDQFFLFIIL